MRWLAIGNPEIKDGDGTHVTYGQIILNLDDIFKFSTACSLNGIRVDAVCKDGTVTNLWDGLKSCDAKQVMDAIVKGLSQDDVVVYKIVTEGFVVNAGQEYASRI